MAIPESTLSKWSDHGAQDTAKRTHEAIRRVLDAYQWPSDMKYDFYLQGSYRNDTNIRGDSDVDIVLQMTSLFDLDTSQLDPYSAQQARSDYGDSLYEWNDFRRLALNVLVSEYGNSIVGQGNKSIKIKADTNRVAADVVVCIGHRRYTSRYQYVEGMTFCALQDQRWIVNYPKLHYDNGASKSRRTSDRFKRSVRMFKNARNRLVSDGAISDDIAPSYFLECLVYKRAGLDVPIEPSTNIPIAHRLDGRHRPSKSQLPERPDAALWFTAGTVVIVEGRNAKKRSRFTLGRLD